MDRRKFLAASVATGTMGAAAVPAMAQEKKSNSAKFKLRYAPGFSSFRGHVGNDIVDNIKFAADQGFTAMFDNGLGNKPAELQKKIAAETSKRGMKLGPFVLYPNFKDSDLMKNKKDSIKAFLDRVKSGIESAKRTGCEGMLVVPGKMDQGLEQDYQTANLIDVMRQACEIVEKDNIMIVLEPLNWWSNHAGQFLYGMPQTFLVCRAVNHPCCKIVNDMYHQQITEGNLIPNIDKCWSEIGAFHVGDNPGRKEPGTGEINYKNVFKHIYKKGFDGVLCCEHGRSKGGKEGEQAFIDAYRWADSYEV